nr:hypothetical protein [Tanacetum cinerariifolium]
DQNTALEREKNELNVKVTDLPASVKVREQEVADLDAQVTAIKLKNDNLVGQVHELEISSVGLQEKVAAYEGLKILSPPPNYHLWTSVVTYLRHGAPSAEADYLSALQHLQSVNFSLIAELKSNKDASVDTIMNLLRLDDVLAERLGLTESQPHVNQLMKMRENISNHVSALRGVFVPLSEPLSATALEGMKGTSGPTPDVATLSTTFVSASTIPPISTDDYEIAHADGQGDARIDDETAADDDMNLFVSNADLNISE